MTTEGPRAVSPSEPLRPEPLPSQPVPSGPVSSAESAAGAVAAATAFGLGLHHVQLASPPGEEEVCRGFYVGVLGMTEVDKPPELAARGGLWVRADALEIHLGVEEDFRPALKAHPGILVADLDALAERLTAHGVAITWDDAFPGYRRFYAADCHRNRLEFLTPRTG
ncbi:glyoxalase [Sphaerisporangium sp. NPDC005288]|uniref:glyoxalase n=1 Tax=Sphaerisporangium sp. NPDC005288 TaxID=3155114 RepID=UPI0033B16963